MTKQELVNEIKKLMVNPLFVPTPIVVKDKHCLRCDRIMVRRSSARVCKPCRKFIEDYSVGGTFDEVL